MRYSLKWLFFLIIITAAIISVVIWLLMPLPLNIQSVSSNEAKLDPEAAYHIQLANLYIQHGLTEKASTEYHLATESKVESLRTKAFAGLELTLSPTPLRLIHQQGQKLLFDLIGFTGPLLLLTGLATLCYVVIRLLPARNRLLIFPFEDYSGNNLGQAVAESIQQHILLTIAIHQRQNTSLLSPTENFNLPTVGLWAETPEGDIGELTSLIVSTSGVPINSLLNQATKWWYNRRPHVRGTIRKQGNVYYLSARLLGKNDSTVPIPIFQVQSSPDNQDVTDLLTSEKTLSFKIMYAMGQDLKAASWNSFAYITEAMWILDSSLMGVLTSSEYEVVTQQLEQAIVVDPNYQLAKYLLGTLYLQHRDLTKSRQLLREVAEKSPDYKWAAIYNLGVSYLQEFEDWAYSYAIRYFDQLIEIKDSSSLARRFRPLGHCGLANVYAQMIKRSRQEECNKFFQKVMDHYQFAMQEAEMLSPQDAGLVKAIALTAKGLAFYQQKRLLEAIESFNAARELRENYALAYIYLSKISLEAEQFDDAEAYIKQALRYHPDSTYLHYRLGRIYESWGKIDSSKNAYTLAHDISNAQNRLGWLFVKSRHYQDAANAFNQAIKLNSKHADATINLASCYLWVPDVTDSELAEATHLAEKAISLEGGGNLWYRHFILGRLYYRQGNSNGALEHLTRAVEINSSCPQCHYYLAELLKDLNDEARAKQHLIEFFQLPGRDKWEEKARSLMHTLAN